jgi:hypothetical protein
VWVFNSIRINPVATLPFRADCRILNAFITDDEIGCCRRGFRMGPYPRITRHASDAANCVHMSTSKLDNTARVCGCCGLIYRSSNRLKRERCNVRESGERNVFFLDKTLKLILKGWGRG